jgi:hypothetical protein
MGFEDSQSTNINDSAYPDLHYANGNGQFATDNPNSQPAYHTTHEPAAYYSYNSAPQNTNEMTDLAVTRSIVKRRLIDVRNHVATMIVDVFLIETL